MKKEYMEYSKVGVHKGIKAAAFIVLIISFIFILRYGATIFVCGQVRNENAVDIDDSNREEIKDLVEATKNEGALYSESYDEIPDLNDAVRVEHLSLMHKDEIRFFYRDGTSYRVFAIDWRTPLVSYIDDNGYNLYYSDKDSEFSGHLKRLVIPFVFFCASVVTLIIIRKKNTDAQGGAAEIQTDIEEYDQGS